jgi:hypothetical protein
MYIINKKIRFTRYEVFLHFVLLTLLISSVTLSIWQSSKVQVVTKTITQEGRIYPTIPKGLDSDNFKEFASDFAKGYRGGTYIQQEILEKEQIGKLVSWIGEVRNVSESDWDFYMVDFNDHQDGYTFYFATIDPEIIKVSKGQKIRVVGYIREVSGGNFILDNAQFYEEVN